MWGAYAVWTLDKGVIHALGMRFHQTSRMVCNLKRINCLFLSFPLNFFWTAVDGKELKPWKMTPRVREGLMLCEVLSYVHLGSREAL